MLSDHSQLVEVITIEGIYRVFPTGLYANHLETWQVTVK